MNRAGLSVLDATDGKRAKKTFYPTPEWTAEKLLSGIDFHMVESVLEPSAGKGDLAFVVAKKMFYAKHNYPMSDTRDKREAIENADIDCIEIDPTLRNALTGAGYRVIHDDFLHFESQKRYSLIVMNPPFDQGAKHLLKALELAEYRGGMIRCILNAETIRNAYTNERITLKEKLDAHNAQIRFVQDQFVNAQRHTDVEIAMVSIDIEAPVIDSSIMEGMRKAPTYKTQEIPNEYSEVVRYNKIDEWVNRYNFEVGCGIKLIEEYRAMAPHMLSEPSSKYAYPILELTFHGKNSYSSISINEYIRMTRKKYWRMIFQQPTIVQKLTSKQQIELSDSVDELKDYEFSAYNILTLIIRMNGKVVNSIEETIIKLFEDWTHLDWHENSPNRHYYNGWKTNKAFRIGKKVIVPFYGAFGSYDNAFRAYNVESYMRDIEKVFDFLDNGRTDWEGSLHSAMILAEATGNTRNIDTKYFKATFYKKGTAHLLFKDMDLLEKFNLFASQRKGWLPPEYGRKRYADMNEEERHVVDSFQGKEKYEQVMAHADFYLNAGRNDQFLLMDGGTDA